MLARQDEEPLWEGFGLLASANGESALDPSIGIKINMRTPLLKHRAILVAVPLLLVGCNAAPSRNILGSYFPSWMVCVLIGLGLSAVVHWMLLKLDMEKELPAPIMVHLAITIAFSFAAWLLWLA